QSREPEMFENLASSFAAYKASFRWWRSCCLRGFAFRCSAPLNMTDEKDASTFYRFNQSFSFQHQREIDLFAFRDVKTIDCEESPAFRWVREKFARSRRRQDDKPWTGCAHELSSATLVQRREKTLNAGAKIPDQTWLLELNRSKLHVRLQRLARHLKELIRGEKPRHDLRHHEGNCDPHTCSCDRDASEQGAAAFSRRRSGDRRSLRPMAREQKCK